MATIIGSIIGAIFVLFALAGVFTVDDPLDDKHNMQKNHKSVDK